jgi:hypothetical protein
VWTKCENSARLSEIEGRPKILVIVLRRLGDVLLTTPLARTLRRGYANATIDMLVIRGTEGILAGNPDIASVITLSARPSIREAVALARRLWRQYDLAFLLSPVTARHCLLLLRDGVVLASCRRKAAGGNDMPCIIRCRPMGMIIASQN